jgi:hypothetical protein
MSHIKDKDERKSGPERRDAPAPDDLMLVDLLYGELDEDARARAERRVREDQALGQDLDAFSNLRALMRELPEAEPPDALTAKLMHAAAAEVSGSRAGAENDEEPQSLWSRLKSLFLPIAMHPGLAAAASLVLVTGIAGVLYVSGDLKPAVPMYEQAEEAQPAATAGAPAAMQAPEGAAAAPAAMQAPEGAAAAPAPSRDESNTIANRAPVRRPVATVPAEPSPEPEVTGAADDYGAEEQSPRRFAQAPAEVEIPATGQALGGRGGYLDEDKDSSRVARRGAESQPAAKPEPKLEAAKEESRRAKAGKKLDLAGSLEDGLEQETRTADVSSKQPSGAPGSGSGAAQGARAGGSQAPQKPVAAPAKTKSPPAAPPPAQAAPPAADRDQAEDPGDSAAPADRKAPARTEAKARERSDGTATRVSDLHQKALAAAARGDCATVRSSGSAIRQLSPSYHRDSFARDARLQKCLSEAVKKK